MKKYGFLILTLAIFSLQSSCSSEPKEDKKTPLSEREQLYQEVIAIHDPVMPKMSDINRVKRRLKDLIETDSMLTLEAKQMVNIRISELLAAENGMQYWMRDFKVPKASDPDQQVIEYLNEEKVHISEISDKMLNSLKKGEELLKQLEKDQKGH